MKNTLTKIFILLVIFISAISLQSCGRKGPLELPNNEKDSLPKEDQEMYE